MIERVTQINLKNKKCVHNRFLQAQSEALTPFKSDPLDIIDFIETLGFLHKFAGIT